VNDTGGFVPDLELWDAWTPDEIAERLSGTRGRWYVLAGWALDLFLGRRSRPHEDLEIGVPRDTFGEIQAALPDCEFFVVGSGEAWPVSESAMAEHFQTWARERTSGLWRVDVIRERWDGDAWVCRRDERIRIAEDALILRTDAGIPYIRPEVALLFKAKAVRPKDDLDFLTVLPALDATRRAWLARALELVHPGHAWLGALEDAD
jgi:hypothetical protein